MKKRNVFISRTEKVLIMIFLLLSFGVLLLLMFSPKAQATLNNEVLENDSSKTLLDTIFKANNYVGPPKRLQRARIRKFRKRQVLDLNTVDSLTLIRVPGIGKSYAHRILSLRKILGGYYSVYQLQEVYGMDADKFLALKPWFAVRTAPKQYKLRTLKAGEIPRHPYLSWQQVKAINSLLNQGVSLTSWRRLMKSGAFSRDDSIRLSPYFIEENVQASGKE